MSWHRSHRYELMTYREQRLWREKRAAREFFWLLLALLGVFLVMGLLAGTEPLDKFGQPVASRSARH